MNCDIHFEISYVQEYSTRNKPKAVEKKMRDKLCLTVEDMEREQ